MTLATNKVQLKMNLAKWNIPLTLLPCSLLNGSSKISPRDTNWGTFWPEVMMRYDSYFDMVRNNF